MDNIKVRNLLTELDKVFCQICSETEALLQGDILQWANELGTIVQSEYTETKNSPTLLLPKTPSEKKAQNKRAKNTLLSQSVLNFTFDVNDGVFLNETVTTRTRATCREVTSKISPSCNDKSKLEISTVPCIKKEVSELDENEEKFSQEVTFVVPQSTSTRTKPVVKKKQPETIPVPENQEEKLTRTLSGTRMGLRNSPKMSRTLSGSPVISINDESSSKRISTKKISEPVSNGPEIRAGKKRLSQTLSPVERVTRNTRSRTASGSPRASKKLKNTSPSPPERHSSLRVCSTSTWSKNELTRTLSHSPVKRSSSVKAKRSESSEKTLLKISPIHNVAPERGEETPKIATTYVLTPKEDVGKSLEFTHSPKLSPTGNKGGFGRMSKTSTPVPVAPKDTEKTPMAGSPDMIGDETEANSDNIDVTYPVQAQNSTSGESEENPIPKKKRKLKKTEETFKENIEESVDTVRITRTKSKALKQMVEESEAKQAELAVFAKKLLNRAKMTSLKKNQLAALLESNISTPKDGPGGILSSKSKYHLLLSSSKKLKTPLATLPNSAIKVAKPSGDKGKRKQESPNEIVIKPAKEESHEKEEKLKSKKEKEKEAALKRQQALRSRQEELKRKNELKQQNAMKQREKLEKEKFNLIQSEKEKEEKHKLILQERQMKLKEEALKKKILTQQKIAETNERRRLEEEARIAKLKEMEAEEQRLALEKQKEQERQEKRAQERLALQKAREEYELQMKQALEAEKLKAEKQMSAKKYLASASKMQSACKRQRVGLPGDKKEWDYKPRNENDYGLEDEHSEVDSEDERNEDRRPPVAWAGKIVNRKGAAIKVMTLEMMSEYMPCYQKTPDVAKMFKMTPSKRIKRTSSAIWNTPSS